MLFLSQQEFWDGCSSKTCEFSIFIEKNYRTKIAFSKLFVALQVENNPIQYQALRQIFHLFDFQRNIDEVVLIPKH